jgi:polyhydroxyalkanoate synthesis regulator phasin
MSEKGNSDDGLEGRAAMLLLHVFILSLVESGKVSGEDVRHVVEDIASSDLGFTAEMHAKIVRHFDRIIDDTYAAVTTPDKVNGSAEPDT